MNKTGEMECVGAGLGCGFDNTNELHDMKYYKAMATADKDKWKEAVKEKYDRMTKFKAFQAVPKNKVTEDAKVLTSTWAMKKKASSYEQVDGEHYDKDTTAAPVVNELTIRIVFLLMIMAGWYAELLDVCGAFIHGKFKKGTQLFMEVPDGCKTFYPSDCFMLLLQTILWIETS